MPLKVDATWSRSASLGGAIWLVLGASARGQVPVPEPAPGLVVVIQGPSASSAPLKQALFSLEPAIRLRVEALPRGLLGAPGTDAFEEGLGHARRAYVDADFPKCLKLLDEAELLPLLAARERALAARLLLWRAACLVGRGELPAAERAAKRMAVMSLEVPAEVEVATPEVETLLARARKEVGQTNAGLSVSVRRSDAAFWIDGKAAPCSEPCALRVPEGDHVVSAEALGASPVTQWVHASAGSAPAFFELPVASAAEAGAQWARAYGAGAGLTSAGSMRLLAQALAAPRLIAVRVDEGTLSGALAVEGELKTAAERHPRDAAGLREDAPGLVRDLLILGKVLEPRTPLYKSTWFWSAVVAAAVGGAAIAAASYRPPPVHTTVSLSP